ncbi:MAG: CocE/NonD family hydrolase [Novosphingobium sp.]
MHHSKYATLLRKTGMERCDMGGKWLISGLVGLSMSALAQASAQTSAQSSDSAFLDQGEPKAAYSDSVRHAYYAPVRDGTQLAITVYAPKGPAAGRYPTLLWYHPGHRESIDRATGTIRTTMAPSDIAFFTAHGYAVAIAEMRGSGASFGTRELDRGPQIARDGKDLVDWIAAQGWSDGKVGMIGASYQGFAQYAVASQRPAALKAIFPEIAGFDDYTSMFHPGGIFVAALSDSASDSIRRDDLNDYLPASARKHLPSVPVVDEDGDGELADEIPLDRNGNGSFLDDGPPSYADGKARQDIYYRASLAHMQNRNLPASLIAAAPHRDSPIAGTQHRYVDLDPGDKPEAIAASGIAVYNRGGWFDYHARDTVMWFATLNGKTPTRVMMAPTGHGSLPSDVGDAIYRAGPYLSLFGDRTSTNRVMNREKLAFFDHYVKGAANGFDRRPPVLLYVMGKGWRYENEWPLKRARSVTLFAGPQGALLPSKRAAGRDSHAVDLSASTLTDNANRWNFGISTSKTPMTFDGQKAARLTYTGAPLAGETEVTGHPVVEIALSSTAPEADVFAYLEDVAPDGSSLLVTEGQLRANYWRPARGGPSGLAKPALPWHGYGKADYAPAPLAGGKVVKLRFDMMPTSWVFRPGHRIRLSFGGADWPSFPVHPGLAGAKGAGKSPVWTVERAATFITLPVVPPRK